MNIKITGLNFDKYYSSIRFLVIGETHGIKENFSVFKVFIKKLISSNKKFHIFWEWPAVLTEEINNYLTGKTNRLKWQNWTFKNCPDGRFSKESLAFLSWLKTINKSRRLPINLFCLDEGGRSWATRDKKMALHLLTVAKKHQRVIFLGIIGSLHARKIPFYLINKKQYFPLVSYLPKEKTITIKIRYLAGEFFNLGFKKIKTENKNTKLMKSIFLSLSYLVLIMRFILKMLIQLSLCIQIIKNRRLIFLGSLTSLDCTIIYYLIETIVSVG